MLFYNYVYNNNLINGNDTLYIFFKKNYGISVFLLKYIEQRIENTTNIHINNLNKNELEHFLLYIYFIIPYKFSFFKKKVINIVLLDLITCYRGWRHFKGLPVRGQRTWSNAWSVYKSNNIMRNFKLKCAKRYYTNVPFKQANIAYTAEYVNLLWERQWYNEWLSAKHSRLTYKGYKGGMRIDLYSMYNYQVMHPDKLNNLSKKQKQAFKKNYFSLGFEPGFTKALLNSVFNSIDINEDSKYFDLINSSLVLRDERLNRKFKKRT